MIARAASVLTKYEVNILFDENIKAGYHNSIWHVVGCAETLGDRVRAIVEKQLYRFDATNEKENKPLEDFVTRLRSAFGPAGPNSEVIRDPKGFEELVAAFRTAQTRTRFGKDVAVEVLLGQLDEDTKSPLEGKRGVLYEVGIMMLRFLAKLEADLSREWDDVVKKVLSGHFDQVRDDPGEKGFLYSKFTRLNTPRPKDEIARRFRTPWSLYIDDVQKEDERSTFKKINPSVGDTPCSDIFLRHDWASVRCKGLPRLASYWTFGDTSNPIRFIYRAAKAHLEPENPNEYDEGLRKLGLDPSDISDRALAYFDRHEYFVRLFLLERPRVSRRMLKINVPYHAVKAYEEEVVETDEGRPFPMGIVDINSIAHVEASPIGDLGNTKSHPSSRGFLQTLCATLKAKDLDLLRLSNRLTHWRSHEESGNIYIVAESRIDDAKDILMPVADAIRESVADFNSEIRKSKKGWRLSTAKPSVRQYSHLRVFVSRPSAFPRAEDVRRVFERLATKRGIQLVWPETFSESVSQTIVGELDQCQAFVQLVTLRTEEHVDQIRGRRVKPDFAWLHYEYGLADAKHMKPIRVIDVNTPRDLLEFYGKIRRDNPHLTFDTAASDSTLREDLSKVVDEVIKVIFDNPLSD
nr:hypothetical protein [Nitrosomonas nitrosa]